MDDEPSPSDLSAALLDHVRQPANWQRLCEEWDRKYPTNPVADQKGEEEE